MAIILEKVREMPHRANYFEIVDVLKVLVVASSSKHRGFEPHISYYYKRRHENVPMRE